MLGGRVLCRGKKPSEDDDGKSSAEHGTTSGVTERMPVNYSDRRTNSVKRFTGRVAGRGIFGFYGPAPVACPRTLWRRGVVGKPTPFCMFRMCEDRAAEHERATVSIRSTDWSVPRETQFARPGVSQARTNGWSFRSKRSTDQ
jgi:hypothetical protein